MFPLYKKQHYGLLNQSFFEITLIRTGVLISP